MKTIEEAAKENATNGKYYSPAYYDAFKLGVEFAQRWIPVEEELPEQTIEINDRNFTYHKFIVINKAGIEITAHRVPQISFSNRYYVFKSMETDQEIESTHWRPIEYK